MRRRLQKAFEERDWSANGKWPVSGKGSTLENTERLRAALPDIFKRYEIKTFVDAPCGDWFWMQRVNLEKITYIGADISSQIVEANKQYYPDPNRSFLHMDITSDPLPEGDLFLCRDCMFHLKTWLRWAFFRNFANSGNKYLLTTVVQTSQNRNLRNNAKFAAFNPMLEPYNFPQPIEIIPETADVLSIDDMATENTGYRHRASFLWKREQIADAVAAHDATLPEGDDK